MSDPSSDANTEAKRNLKTLERLRQLSQEVQPKAEPKSYLRSLMRRVEYLDQKLSEHDCSAAAESYHRSERRALVWAIKEIVALYPHLIGDVDQKEAHEQRPAAD